MARPSKLTEETKNLICKAIENGATYNVAAAIAGVSYSAFNLWMQKGREATRKNKYLQFLEAVETSNAICLAKMAEKMVKSADKDWRAAESFLKRRDPENWGDKSKTDITGKITWAQFIENDNPEADNE
jgi:hypothetical protein